MGKIISFSNQKGGVGKTTSVSEIAENLSQEYDKKVLMIDLDPQASLTSLKDNMHEIISNDEGTMTDIMMRRLNIEDIIRPIKNNLYLAPTTLVLSDAELNLVNATMRELILEKELSKIKDNYDYILIDCPPSRGILTVNALSSSDSVTIPVQAEYQALLGMQLLKNTIKNVKDQINEKLNVSGYIITMATHTNHSNDIIKTIMNDSIPVIAKIPRSIDISDAGVANESTYAYNHENKSGIEYLKLTKYILENK